MTIREASHQLIDSLKKIYNASEAANIADLSMEHLTGMSRIDRIVNNEKMLSPGQDEQLREMMRRLMQHEPIQYVLNEAWFCGMKFYVDQNVLIPRPETEELVEWVLTDAVNQNGNFKILDVGSGSGCIPIAIKTKLKEAEVWSCDISEPALRVAQKNAADLGASIHFIQIDFLNEGEREQLFSFDLIVSNPPYVPVIDKGKMDANVLDFEPDTALFVPDNDPLVFYSAIADFAKNHLKEKGQIFVELHEDFGNDAINLFRSQGFIAEIKKDMQGKDRMLKAVKGY
jgi:release factor glutamine methyltransferase